MSAAVAMSANEFLFHAGNTQDHSAIPGMPQGLSSETELMWRNLFKVLSASWPEPRHPMLNLRLAGVTTMLLLAARLEARMLSAMEDEKAPLPPAALLRETFRLRAQAARMLEEIRSEDISEHPDPLAMSPAASADSVPAARGGQSGCQGNRTGEPQDPPAESESAPAADSPAPLLCPGTGSVRSLPAPIPGNIPYASPPERSSSSVFVQVSRPVSPADQALWEAAVTARQHEDAWVSRLSRGRKNLPRLTRESRVPPRAAFGLPVPAATP